MSPARTGAIPFAWGLQLSGLGGRGLRVQRGDLDAAHRPGLAGPHPADPPQRRRRGRGDGAAVRPVAAAAAPYRFRGRPPRPAQAADGHPSGDGGAVPGAGTAHRLRAGHLVAGGRVRLPARMRDGLRRAGAPDLRLRTGGRGGSVQRGGAELRLVQTPPARSARRWPGSSSPRWGRVGPSCSTPPRSLRCWDRSTCCGWANCTAAAGRSVAPEAWPRASATPGRGPTSARCCSCCS